MHYVLPIVLCICNKAIMRYVSLAPKEVGQEAGPDVIWRLSDAAWLYSFRVWTSHCICLDHAYLYLRLYLRGTVHCLLAYCQRIDHYDESSGGTVVKKPQVWSPLALYRHVIISFMTFWPCRTSSGLAHQENKFDISYLKTSQACWNIPIHSSALLAAILSQLAAPEASA